MKVFPILCLMLQALPVQAAGTTRVAVRPFEIYSDESGASLKDLIAEELSSRLAAGGKLEVVDQARVRNTLADRPSLTFNEATLRTLSQKLEAPFLVLGSMTKIADNVSLDAYVFSGSGTQLFLKEFSEGKNLDSVTKAVADKVSARILLLAPPPPEQKVETPRGEMPPGKKLGLPEPVLQIIAQHHELLDGSGYPKGLKGEAVHPLARIVALVNHYDNLCNPLRIQKALTPHEALSQMFAQHRSRFDAKVLQLMIRSLGVYPPGTIVRLNNEALALVSSVNTQKPLRPWVVIYDPETPSSEAVMVNLEEEPDINISKALRPSQLPTEVVEYLSPRKRVTYYFDSSSDKPANP